MKKLAWVSVLVVVLVVFVVVRWINMTPTFEVRGTVEYDYGDCMPVLCLDNSECSLPRNFSSYDGELYFVSNATWYKESSKLGPGDSGDELFLSLGKKVNVHRGVYSVFISPDVYLVKIEQQHGGWIPTFNASVSETESNMYDFSFFECTSF